MKPLGLVDQLFLMLERPKQPMHIGELTLFSYPQDADENYVSKVAEMMRRHTAPCAPFNLKLKKCFGQYAWVADDQFDIEYHVHHIALPAPGHIDDLLSIVSTEHCHLLDRERPLWQVYLIDIVGTNKFALYIKAHHSMMDGVAAMRMNIRAMSFNPLEISTPPFWAMDVAKSKKKRNRLPKLVNPISLYTKSATTLYNAIKHKPIKPSAPDCFLNQSVTGSRRFAAQSISLDRVRNIARHYGVTINDVVLAICGSALRAHLIYRDDLPKDPLISMVPVSIRKDEGVEGNEIAMILASLGTHIASPVARLAHIHASIDKEKKRLQQMTKEEVLTYTALSMAPTGAHIVTGKLNRLRAFNVIISNIPGPEKAMYWNGAKIEGIYPVSIPVGGVALNITLFSYMDRLEFGFTACRRTLPSLQRLVDYLVLGVDELEKAANITPIEEGKEQRAIA